MEMFLASDQDQWDLIKEVIDDSDYYVVIVGARYGSVDDEGLSYAEKEFDYAVATGKRVLGFVHAHPGSIPIEKSEATDDGRTKLRAFVTKVRQRPFKTFGSPAELAANVAAVSRAKFESSAEGWVCGRFAQTPERAAEVSELRAQLADQELKASAPDDAPPRDIESIRRATRVAVTEGQDERADHYFPAAGESDQGSR